MSDVPALQTGKYFAYGEPRACALRFTLGYNMAGFQPYGGARTVSATSRSQVVCDGRMEPSGTAEHSDIAAAGAIAHCRAPPEKNFIPPPLRLR